MPAWLSEGLACDGQPLTVSSHGRRHECSLLGLFYKNTNPIHESSTYLIYTPLQRPHILVPSHLGINILAYQFGGDVGKNVPNTAYVKHSS